MRTFTSLIKGGLGAAALVVLGANVVRAQTTIVNYNFNSGTSYATLAPALAANITCSANSSEAFATVGGTASGAGAFTVNGTAGNAVTMNNSSGTNTRYFTFALGGAALSSYDTFKVYFQGQRSAAGAQTATVRYSLNGGAFTDFAANTMAPGNGSFVQATITLPAGVNNPSSTLEFRVLASGASGSGTFRIDNFQVQGVISEPTTQASSVTFSSVQQTQMGVSWTSGNGASRLVICRQGSAPSSGPVDGTGYTADASFSGSGTALGGGKVVYAGTGSSFTLTGLSAGTTYYLQVYEYRGSGATANYLTSTATGNPNSQATQSAANSTASDIIRAGGFSEPTDIAYATYQAADITSGNSIELARFAIRDGGATTDADALGTTLDSITFTAANGANLRRVALYDGSTEIAEVAGGASVVFSGLSGLATADGGTKDLSVRATFNTTVTDNQQLQFTVSSASANAAGSAFAAANAGGAASDVTGNANRLEVTATKLVFSTVPSSVNVGANFTAVVQARDANENVDLDSTASVTITKASGSGTLTGGGAQSLASGAQTWASLQIDASGVFTLQAAGGSLTAATSGSIIAVGRPLAIAGYMVNPAGTDSPYEYVQVIALEAVDFSVTPMSVVWNNNGTATANGWVDGGSLTYKFNITSGTLNAGDVAYVGGSGKLINGSGSTDISGQTWLRSLDYTTTAGDGFGAAGSSAGNGGANADGVAIFATTTLTDTTVPIDAVFFGTGLGSTVVSGGADGYVLPVNDLYSGGYLQAASTFFLDPASGGFTKLSGTYNTLTRTWTTARTASTVASPTAIGNIATGIILAAPAAEPTTQATSVSFASVQAYQMNVSWTSGNGANRLVICRAGSAPSSGPVDASTYTADANFAGAGSALGGGKVVYSGSGSSFTLTGLSASTTYHLEVYEFNGTGVNVNYLTSTASGNPNSQATTAPPNSTLSDIVRASGFSEPVNVAYSSYQAADITDLNSIELARFTIRDGGGSADADTFTTALDSISFTVANGANLRRVALYDGTTEIAEVAGGASASFSGLSGLVAVDGGSKNFSVRATFNAAVTDNQQLQFTVNAAGANVAGSTFAAANAGGAASDITGDANRIEVTATKLAFSTVPSGVTIAVNFTAVVQAQDALNSVDLDNTASVTVIKASGTGTLTGGGAQSLASGAQTWSTLQIDATGSFTLQASGGSLTAAASGSISASAGPTTLAAGDIAVIGYNTSGAPDNFAILVMKELGAGTVFYVNDNEVASAGGTAFTDLGEVEASFTVKAGQTIPAGTVIVLPWGAVAVSTATYDWSTTSGAGLSANNEELYLYTAADITATTPSAFIYGVRVGTSASARPNGLTAGMTWITPPPSGTAAASRYKISGATYTATTNALLTAIGDVPNNWETAASYTMASGDWTFTIITPAAEPTTQASGIAFGNILTTSMDVSWTSGNGANRLVICRAGAAPSSGPVDGTAYTADASFTGAGSALGGGKVVYSGSGNSFTLTGLNPSTTYHLQVFEYNGSGGTLNYLTAAASGNPNSTTTDAISNSSQSDIARSGSFTEPTDVAYASYQATDITAGNSVELARFTIRDGGGATDSDAASTTLDAITLTAANGANLRRVALYDGATEVAEVAGGASVVFSGLSGLVAADGGTKEFSVRATFNATVTDNQQVQFTVSSASANAGGSSFAAANAGGAASDITGNANRIEVTATKLVFSSLPANVSAANNFSAVVQARDANENVDLDATTSVTITKNSGSGALSGGGAQSLSSGAQTWASLQLSSADTYTLRAAGGALTDAVSGNIVAAAGATTLAAGDIAVIGYNSNGSPDNFAILVLKSLGPGTVFYVNDNEIASADGTAFTDLNEQEASFTVKAGQTIPAGTVIILPWGQGAVSTTTYDWSTTSSAGLGNNNEEIYVYTATGITASTPTAFIYGVRIGTSTSARPSGLTAGTTWITPPPSGTAAASRYKIAGATYASTTNGLLAAIGDVPSNWETAASYTLASGDWTFSLVAPAAEPTSQASGINFASVTASQMDVAWTSGNGANRLVICRAGSAPSSGPVDGASYAADASFTGAGSVLGGGKVVYAGSGSSFTLTGLSASTTYHMQVYEYSGAGGAQNYLTTSSAGNPNSQATVSSGLSSASDIVRATGFSEPADIAYAAYQAADITALNSIELARFTIRDGAGSADGDAASTALTNLTLAVGNGTALRRIALYDGATEIAEVAGGATVTFSALAGLAAADDGSKDFSVRATFNAAVTDNQQLQFAITGASALAGASAFAAADASGAASDVSGNANRIEVTATKLVFSAVQSAVIVGQNFAATVQARDANENADLDSATSVTISKAAGSGTLTGGGAQALSGGAQTWSLQIDAAGSFTIQATDGILTGVTSGTITATVGLAAGDLALIGRINNGTPDSFALLTLASIPAGTVVYFTDNAWSNATFRGASEDGDGNENLTRLTFNSALGAGTIIRSVDTADARWTWATSGAIPFGGSATFQNLNLGQSGEQIYAFQAANLTTNPLGSASSHLFVLDDTAGFETLDSSSQGDIPPGLSSNAHTALSFNFSGNSVIGLNMALVGAQSYGTKAEWLAFIGDAANWTTSATGLPSGGVSFGATCDAGRAPVLVSLSDKTATVNAPLSFTFFANDPTCPAPALSATGLPSGAMFGYVPAGSNSQGTFTWTPSISQTGTHLVRFTATDSQPLSTSLNIRVYVRGAGEATNSAGVPVSQTNWAVTITNLDFGTGNNATVVWQSVAGIAYDVYRSSNSFGAGMAWTRIVSGSEASATQAALVVTAASTQQFFQVVPAGFSPTSNGVWGVIRPMIKPSAFTMLAPPLRSDRRFNGEFGTNLAAVLTGSNNGVLDEGADEVFFFRPDGSWENLYLDESRIWRESGGGVATQVLRLGQGVLVQHKVNTLVRPVFAGQVGNTSQSTTTLADGWSLLSLSEGKLVPLATAFNDLPSGALNADWAEERADLLILLAGDGSWDRYQRAPDGQWYSLKTLTPATNSLTPGQAYYFRRVDGTGAMDVRY